MKAFYFVTEERKLRYDDERDIEVGITHIVEGEIELCKCGLHASERLIDARSYASGNILYLVELSGNIIKDTDRCVSSKRTYLEEFDATEVLNNFARKQGLLNLELIKSYYNKNVYKLITNYLETSDENIREAAEAAVEAEIEKVTKIKCLAAWAAYAVLAAVSEFPGVATAFWSARASNDYTKALSEANEMLTDMIREATGWDI